MPGQAHLSGGLARPCGSFPIASDAQGRPPCGGGPRRLRARARPPLRWPRTRRSQARARRTSAGIEAERVVPVAPRGARAATGRRCAGCSTSIATSARPPGSLEARRAAVPQHDPLAVLDDPVADVAVGGQRVDVERQQPVRREVRAHRPQRALHVVRRYGRWLSASSRQVTRSKRPYDAAARTCRRRGSPRAPASLLPGDRRHPGRAVAADRLVAEIEQRLEALAGPAGDVERSPAAQAVLAGEPVDRPQPRAVGVAGGQEVVGRREDVVGAGGGGRGRACHRRLTRPSAEVVSTLGKVGAL